MTAVCPCGCTAPDRTKHPEGYNPGGWAPIDAWAHHHYSVMNQRDTRCGAFLDHCRTLLTYQHEKNLPFAGKLYNIRALPKGAVDGFYTTWRARAELPTGHTIKVRVHWQIVVNADHTVVVKCGIGVQGDGSIFLGRADDTLQTTANDWLAQATAIHAMLSTAHHTRRFILEHVVPQQGLRSEG